MRFFEIIVRLRAHFGEQNTCESITINIITHNIILQEMDESKRIEKKFIL